MMVMAVFADWITLYDPMANDFGVMHEAPSAGYWLGTDQFGRDVYTRIVYGARTALLVGFASAFIGGSIGLVLGVGSAYFGGRIDLIFQRVMDVFMAFPLIILALAVVSIFGTGVWNVIIAITIPSFRAARASSGRARWRSVRFPTSTRRAPAASAIPASSCGTWFPTSWLPISSS